MSTENKQQEPLHFRILRGLQGGDLVIDALQMQNDLEDAKAQAAHLNSQLNLELQISKDLRAKNEKLLNAASSVTLIWEKYASGDEIAVAAFNTLITTVEELQGSKQEV